RTRGASSRKQRHNLSRLHSRPSLSRPEERPRCGRGIPEVPRSFRSCAELPARLARPPATRPRLCHLWRHCQSQIRLQGFPHPLERRRPRHPHPEGSQDRVREVAVASSLTCGCFGKGLTTKAKRLAYGEIVSRKEAWYTDAQLNEAVCTLAAGAHCRLIFNKLLCNESTPNT